MIVKLEKFDKNDPDLALMTMKDWIDAVNDGSFIDYDGHGRLATDTEKSNLIVYPSDVENNRIMKVFVDNDLVGH